MKVCSLALLLLSSASVASAAEQSWFSQGVAGLGGSLHRYLKGDKEEKCEAITVSFNTAADGTELSPPLCVENEWASLGMAFFAEGGEGTLPCLFDTANPGNEEDGGDEDLGSPNEGCTPSGPGVGEGGAPGEDGENCEELGMALVVQEKGVDVPDDSKNGGILTIDFPNPGGQYVYDIGLLDIDYETSVVVVYEKDEEGTLDEYELEVPILGDNSYQTFEINKGSVRWIKVMFSKSGALTHCKFCPLEPKEPTASPVEEPTNSPPTTDASSPSPSASPSESPSESPTESGDEPTPDVSEPTETPPVDEPTTSPVEEPTKGSEPTPDVSEPTETPPTEETPSKAPPTITPATEAPPTLIPPAPTDTCVTSGCCLEECCGADTKWNADIEYCVSEPGSPGFDGTYSKPDYDDSCKTRTCCEVCVKMVLLSLYYDKGVF